MLIPVVDVAEGLEREDRAAGRRRFVFGAFEYGERVTLAEGNGGLGPLRVARSEVELTGGNGQDVVGGVVDMKAWSAAVRFAGLVSIRGSSASSHHRGHAKICPATVGGSPDTNSDSLRGGGARAGPLMLSYLVAS